MQQGFSACFTRTAVNYTTKPILICLPKSSISLKYIAMVSIIDFKDLKYSPKLRCKGIELVKWNGHEVKVIKFSLRESTLPQRILDLMIVLFLGLITFWALLEFPCFQSLKKAAFSGRQSIFYVDFESFPKISNQCSII